MHSYLLLGGGFECQVLAAPSAKGQLLLLSVHRCSLSCDANCSVHCSLQSCSSLRRGEATLSICVFTMQRVSDLQLWKLSQVTKPLQGCACLKERLKGQAEGFRGSGVGHAALSPQVLSMSLAAPSPTAPAARGKRPGVGQGLCSFTQRGPALLQLKSKSGN